MKTTTITEITVETTEILVMHRRGNLVQSFCDECRKQTAMLRLEEAALEGVSLQAISRAVMAGRLHLFEPDDGTIFICLNSLFSNICGEAAGPATCPT